MALVIVLLGLIPILAQEVEITIGQNTEQHYAPIYVTRGASLYQCIYQEEDIGRPGKIAGITLYPQSTTNLAPFPIKIWLGTTPKSNLSDGTIPSTVLTNVFQGEITIQSGSLPLYIPFQDIFRYHGDNLVMMIYKLNTNTPYNTPCKFSGYRSIQPLTSKFFWSFNYNSSYNPANPPQTTTDMNFFPKISFRFLPLFDGTKLACVPRSLEFDPTWISHPRQETIKLSNPGTQDFEITGLELSDPVNYSVVNLPVLPISLMPGETRDLSIRYLPAAIGENRATLTIRTGIMDPLGNIVDFRATTGIPLMGSCADAYISSAPQTLNFDNATAPDLPPFWSSVMFPATSDCIVSTSTVNPHSTPNSASIQRQSSTTASVYLVSPPMAPSLDASNKRLRFYARSDSNNGSLSVGVMSDPSLPATFRFIRAISLEGQNQLWTLCYVNLGTVLPYEHHFAFRTNENDHGSIFIDDVTIEDYLLNDLQAVSLSNPVTGVPGVLSTFTLLIKNWGRYTETSYTVKIMRTDGVQIASAPGLPIPPLGSREIPVVWYTTGHGELSFFAKVVMDDDLNPSNDSTLVGQMFIMTSDGQEVDIGQAQYQDGLPFSFTQYTSLSETIFLASEMGTSTGKLEAIFLKPHTYEDIPPMHIKIWLGLTEQNTIVDGWISTGDLTPVFDGMIEYLPGTPWLQIPLDTPYLYKSNSNLVMLTQHPWEPIAMGMPHTFWVSEGNSTLFSESYDNFINPDDPGIISVRAYRPLTKFIKDPGFIGSIYGTVSYPGGQPVVGATISIPRQNVQTTTNLNGSYNFSHIPMGEVVIDCNLAGYFQVQDTLLLNEGEILAHNFNLQTIPLVAISGTVLTNDTELALPNTMVQLTGYQTYSMFTDNNGYFEFPGINGGMDYTYSLSHTSNNYGPSTGTIHIPLSGGDLGNLFIGQATTPPTNVMADLNPDAMSVYISWELDTSLRPVLGYQVWRTPLDQEDNLNSWVLLTPALIPALTYTDLLFASAPQGGYVWAVKSVYSNGISSGAAFSNRLYKLTSKGVLSCHLTTLYGEQPIVNANIAVGSGGDCLITHSDAQGNFYYLLFPGTYSMDIQGFSNNQWYYWNGSFSILGGVITQLDLELEPFVDVNDPGDSPPLTELKQNYPNPFRDETYIRFSIEEAAPVTLEIFNLRGQQLRSILHETKAGGQHEIVWDGKDENGHEVGNGVFIYRMTCGKFKYTKKMLRTK